MQDVKEVSGSQQKGCSGRTAMFSAHHGDGANELFASHSWAPSVCGAGKVVALCESRFYVV